MSDTASTKSLSAIAWKGTLTFYPMPASQANLYPVKVRADALTVTKDGGEPKPKDGYQSLNKHQYEAIRDAIRTEATATVKAWTEANPKGTPEDATKVKAEALTAATVKVLTAGSFAFTVKDRAPRTTAIDLAGSIDF